MSQSEETKESSSNEIKKPKETKRPAAAKTKQPNSTLLMVLGALLTMGAISWIVYDSIYSPGPPAFNVLTTDTRFSPEVTADEEKAFKEAKDAAEEKLDATLAVGTRFKFASNLLQWLGVVGGALVTLLSGWFGRPLKPDEAQNASVEEVLGRVAQSKWETRLVGLLLASIMVVGFVGDRCAVAASGAWERGETLNNAITQRSKEFRDATNAEDREAVIRQLRMDASR